MNHNKAIKVLKNQLDSSKKALVLAKTLSAPEAVLTVAKQELKQLKKMIAYHERKAAEKAKKDDSGLLELKVAVDLSKVDDNNKASFKISCPQLTDSHDMAFLMRKTSVVLGEIGKTMGGKKRGDLVQPICVFTQNTEGEKPKRDISVEHVAAD